MTAAWSSRVALASDQLLRWIQSDPGAATKALHGAYHPATAPLLKGLSATRRREAIRMACARFCTQALWLIDADLVAHCAGCFREFGWTGYFANWLATPSGLYCVYCKAFPSQISDLTRRVTLLRLSQRSFRVDLDFDHLDSFLTVDVRVSHLASNRGRDWDAESMLMHYVGRMLPQRTVTLQSSGGHASGFPDLGHWHRWLVYGDNGLLLASRVASCLHDLAGIRCRSAVRIPGTVLSIGGEMVSEWP